MQKKRSTTNLKLGRIRRLSYFTGQDIQVAGQLDETATRRVITCATSLLSGRDQAWSDGRSKHVRHNELGVATCSVSLRRWNLRVSESSLVRFLPTFSADGLIVTNWFARDQL